jgi:hypothetical protein
MTYALATVRGKYLDPVNNIAATGIVTWFPTSPIVDSIGHVTLTPPSDSIVLDSNGMFTVQVVPTDTAGLSAFAWAFNPAIQSVPGSIQYLLVPLTGMPGGGWWIDQLATAPGY